MLEGEVKSLKRIKEIRVLSDRFSLCPSSLEGSMSPLNGMSNQNKTGEISLSQTVQVDRIWMGLAAALHLRGENVFIPKQKLRM